MPSTRLKSKISAWFKKDHRETFMERIKFLLESELIFSGDPPAIKYANTLKHILANISLKLDGGDILAGGVVETVPSELEYKNISNQYKKWWDAPFDEIIKASPFYYNEHSLKNRPPWFLSLGHVTLDWEGLVKGGLRAFRDRAAKSLEGQRDEDKKNFLQGLIICYGAVSDYIKRYAAEARRKRNEELASRLDNIAHDAPGTFAEALSLIWIVTLICQKICGCGALSFSRMDKYLLELYGRDIARGRLTADAALTIVEEFYFKNNEISNPSDPYSYDTEASACSLEADGLEPNTITLGGRNADGSSGVNELSYLMLNAAAGLKLKNPIICVRWYKGMDNAFFTKAVEAMAANASVALVNDETMIPALKALDVKDPEVYDYGFCGGNNPSLGPFDGGLRQVWINLLRPLELALNRGDYPLWPRSRSEAKDCEFPPGDRAMGTMTGAYYGVDTGDPGGMADINAVIHAYKEQLSYLLGEYRRGFELDFELEKQASRGRMRIEDCFLRGTAGDAVSWTLGGVKYHKVVVQGAGLANVADALYAIDRLVYKDKAISLGQFASLLSDNFGGKEALRKALRKNYPKFGNGAIEVDEYAKIVAGLFSDTVRAHNGAKYLYQFFPALASGQDFAAMGSFVGATPDGRRSKEAISENLSPAFGADRSGLRALLESVSHIPFEKITGGTLNIKIRPSSLRGDMGINPLAVLLKAYLQNGGMQVQVNAVDSDMLIRAQDDPAPHRELCLWIGGHSAFYTETGAKTRQEIAARTEHSVGT